MLERLDGVRKSGNARWIARCPAHEDRSPSLSLAERDGKPLIHCFAGCEPLAVLEAVGLDWRAVLPPDDRYSRPLREVQRIAERRARAESYIEIFVSMVQNEGWEPPPEAIERVKRARAELRRLSIPQGWSSCG